MQQLTQCTAAGAPDPHPCRLGAQQRRLQRLVHRAVASTGYHQAAQGFTLPFRQGQQPVDQRAAGPGMAHQQFHARLR